MTPLGIIADDLTGASDTGVQFARRGLATVVLFDPALALRPGGAAVPTAPSHGLDARVVAVDTASRHLAPAAAYARVAETAAILREAGIREVFKKVDSTLRGNLGAEIDAVADRLAFDFVAVAPALPALGRVTLDGQHLLHGVPVHETEIGRDPAAPVRESNVVALLAASSRRRVGHVTLATVRRGEAAIAGRSRELLAHGVEIAVFDAQTDADLRQIVAGTALLGRRTLHVGSAGLAEAVAVGLAPAPVRASSPAVPPDPPTGAPARPGNRAEEARGCRAPATGGPVLLVAGSVSAVTLAQVARFVGQPGVVAVGLDARRVIERAPACGCGPAQAEVELCRARVVEALRAGRDVAFHNSGAPESVAAVAARARALGLSGLEVAERITDAIGEVAAGAIEQAGVERFILAGGETARAVCRRLGATGIRLCREVEPGVPIGRLLHPRSLTVVSKAGAFGTPDTLVRALQVLKTG